MKKAVLIVALAICGATAHAAESVSGLSYDVSGGTGSHNGTSYSEIHLGLNWYPEEWLNWRNSVFSQFGSNMNTIYGLDTAALFGCSAYTQGRALGIELFAGPGLRFANENSNAIFGEAGIIFALGGLRLGGGVQQLHYTSSSRTDKNNRSLPQDETQYFITVSGGGVL